MLMHLEILANATLVDNVETIDTVNSPIDVILANNTNNVTVFIVSKF
jgi:hypothetical protein